ncbi:hypothetical protein HPB47_024726, partial [Ixodes persulcatus]
LVGWRKQASAPPHKLTATLRPLYEYAKTHPQKLVYVALSRCININSLYLTNSSGDHCFYHRDANADKNMADEFERLQKHKLDTVTHRYLLVLETGVHAETEFTLALLNTRSLSAHALDIERDPVLSKVDVLCFTETWNAVNVDIAGYATVARTQGFGRPAGGVEIYVKRSDKRSVNALDLQLRPTADQRSNGEHCAASVYGVNVMTMYLAPNLSRTAVEQYIDEAMGDYQKQYADTHPFMLIGDFNVNVMKSHWIVEYMSSHHSLQHVSYDDRKQQPTTIHGTCNDPVFTNFKY